VKELLSRSSIANVVAGIVIVGALAYSLYYEDVEMLKYLAMFSAGYLFGKGAVK